MLLDGYKRHFRTRTFWFESGDGHRYQVTLRPLTGRGIAYMAAGPRLLEMPLLATVTVAFAFDPEAIRDRDDSHLFHAPIFGPNHNQSLDDVLRGKPTLQP